MGCAASGAMDANSFHASIRGGCTLPPPSSLTYQGFFNQHTYHAGPPERSAACAVSARAAWMPSIAGVDDQGNNDVWVGCFLKSCRDGRPRDGRPIDIVAVLDVSGSMQGSIDGTRSRLDLAKDALKDLFAQLREDDRFGLATFTTVGIVVQPLELVSTLRAADHHEELLGRIQDLAAGGGTTLVAGMDAAAGICKDAATLDGPRHRRLLFLTDMQDLQAGQLGDMIAAQAKQELYVSFIGIGLEFNSKLADEVTMNRGANYFCITRDEELRKVVVDNFHFNFFPAAFEVEVAQQSDAFDLVAVYGTPFDTREEKVEDEWLPDTHKFYPPEFKAQAKELMLCSGRYTGSLPSPALQQMFGFLSPSARTIIRVDTIFPSAVKPDESIEGGLILLRMRPRSVDVTAGTVRLMLKYVVGEEKHSSSEDLEVPASLPSVTPDPAIAKGVTLQRFVDVCRQYLTLVHEHVYVAEEPEESRSRHISDLRAALGRIDKLLAELAALSEDEADALCPGVRGELKEFGEMVHKHFAEEEVRGGAEKNLLN